MRLGQLNLKPHTKYRASVRSGQISEAAKRGEWDPSGSMVISKDNFEFSTDGTGRVSSCNQNIPGLQPEAIADTWEFLTLENLDNGETEDLRLLTAGFIGDVDLAKAALSEGADINERFQQNATALHCSAASGHSQLVRFLVEQGADIDLVDDLGWTPIFLAYRERSSGIVELLYKNGAKMERVIQGKSVEITFDKNGD